MTESSPCETYTLLSLTDDALIEIFRFLVLIDRHSDHLANGSWISLANTCPRLALVYKSFLRTYCIETDEIKKRLQNCPKCYALYDHPFYLSITKLTSPRISVLKIPKTCSHMQASILNAVVENIPNLRHLDCTRMPNYSQQQTSDASPDILTKFMQCQKKIETLSVNTPPRFLLSTATASLSTLKKLQLRTCDAAVIDNLVSFLDVHGSQLKHITVTIRSPPSSHQKHVILVEDTFKSKNIVSPSSYSVVAILASQILQSATVSEIDISDNVRLSTLYHDVLRCPLRMPGQCDSCTRVDQVHYLVGCRENSFFRRPHYRAFIHAEDKLKLYRSCLFVPRRPQFKLTACLDGMAIELKKQTRVSGHDRETLPNIMKWSPVLATTLTNMLDMRQVPSPNTLDYRNLIALEIDYGWARSLTMDAISHALPDCVLPTLRRARNSLISLSLRSSLNLTENQFGSVLRAVNHILVLDVGSTFILNLYTRRKLDWVLNHFRKLRVLKIVTDDAYSSAMLTSMPTTLRCVERFCRWLRCITINNDIELKDLSTKYMSLLTGSTHAIAEGRRVLRDVRRSMPRCDFSSVDKFYNSWDDIIFGFLDKLTSDPLASIYQ